MRTGKKIQNYTGHPPETKETQNGLDQTAKGSSKVTKIARRGSLSLLESPDRKSPTAVTLDSLLFTGPPENQGFLRPSLPYFLFLLLHFPFVFLDLLVNDFQRREEVSQEEYEERQGQHEHLPLLAVLMSGQPK